MAAGEPLPAARKLETAADGGASLSENIAMHVWKRKPTIMCAELRRVVSNFTAVSCIASPWMRLPRKF